ncbi:hypothetical protein BDA99DRAFT_560320 [Phascolomyces articulosus]|uniref:Uncharacterized protein n=1 Tax=Phascolomyces articulosus TaxID=60185 RepID=A0AAD5PDJ8_9FUNG|nr:hypothetical protein BDA99DRAFT_560320 [Phascolomyces articulosus]
MQRSIKILLLDYVKKEFQFGKYGKVFDKDLFQELKKAFTDVKNGNMTRLEAQCLLYPLAQDSAPLYSKIIISVARLTSTNAMNENENYASAYVSANGRPDVMMSVSQGLRYSRNIDFAEVQSIQQRCNNFMISKDLIRLGLFSKETVNDNNSRACLTMQSVGLTTIFYISTLIADGI